MIWTPKGVIIAVIDCIYLVRLVLVNFMVVYSHWYEGRATLSPAIESYDKAIYLLIIEYIVINILYYLIIKNDDINFNNRNLKLRLENDNTKDFIYLIFIIINILLVFFNRDNISFLGIGQDDNSQIMGDEASSLSTLISISMYVAKYIVLGFIIRYFYQKYLINKSYIYIISSVVMVLLINMIFIGHNRMDAMLPIIASLILLNYIYGKKMIIFNVVMAGFAILALYSISLLRGTFQYNITNDVNSLITDYLQVYFGGIYNIALSLEIGNLNPNSSLITFLYDLVRPFLGLNFLWRSDNVQMSTTLFNFRIFGRYDHVTQIIPLVGQFYLLFGVLAVLIAPLIVISLLKIFLKFLKGSYFIDSIILIPIIIRLCFTFFQNISIFINEMSSLIIIYGFLRLITYIIKQMSTDSVSEYKEEII
ncbi:hypothetical protein [Staphylococcus devriesei]|uniref:hypothetical protein n=1 Tax=Staphylococcus devriesei TaxID=586733 RepID=UPI001F34F75B|nr:hypothetical protein [Staphylococcus devriesei]MCE5090379.1 hypothetical protein [Staphylococcus devriesei]